MAALRGGTIKASGVSAQASRGRQGAQCTSLKANMGHLEACAAAAGLASLLVTPLLAGLVPTNAQLRLSAVGTLVNAFAEGPAR